MYGAPVSFYLWTERNATPNFYFSNTDSLFCSVKCLGLGGHEAHTTKYTSMLLISAKHYVFRYEVLILQGCPIVMTLKLHQWLIGVFKDPKVSSSTDLQDGIIQDFIDHFNILLLVLSLRKSITMKNLETLGPNNWLCNGHRHIKFQLYWNCDFWIPFVREWVTDTTSLKI